MRELRRGPPGPAAALVSAAVAQLRGSEAAEEGACGAAAEYGVRLCSAPRAPRTCGTVRLLGVSERAGLCAWREACMRCVPRPGFLNSSCSVDGLLFESSGDCPSPRDGGLCGDCGGLQRQELCLGLCSELCVWADVSRFGGQLCAPRVPVVQPKDDTMRIVLMVLGGAAGLVVLALLGRMLLKLRARALEEAEARRIAVSIQRRQRRNQMKRGATAKPRRQRLSQLQPRSSTGSPANSSSLGWEQETLDSAQARSRAASGATSEDASGTGEASGMGEASGTSDASGTGEAGGADAAGSDDDASGSGSSGAENPAAGTRPSGDGADTGSRWRRGVDELSGGARQRTTARTED